jgi:hypothetical protein
MPGEEVRSQHSGEELRRMAALSDWGRTRTVWRFSSEIEHRTGEASRSARFTQL